MPNLRCVPGAPVANARSRAKPLRRSTRAWGSSVRRRIEAVGLALAFIGVGCSQQLDAGSTRPHGPLPVDERNPIVITNDGAFDNWQAEYALLFASGAGPVLAGIVVSASSAWPNLDANVAGYRALVAAARESGLRNVPDPIASVSTPLDRPASGRIEDTVANRSEGALFLLELSARLSLPHRPLVVVTGGRLTDVADAYLVEPAVAERVIVVSSLGTTSASGAAMGTPNGEMDPWADAIVASRLRYVQVSAYYDQLTDVPDSRVSELPANAFGSWIAAKQPRLLTIVEAADQVGVISVGLSSFAVAVERVSASALVGAGATAGPNLIHDSEGQGWLVTENASALATARFWELLRDPSTFAP